MTLHPKRLVAMIATVAAGSAVAATFAVSTASAAVATDASTSANWAGYVADNATFSSVSGSWVVPSAKCTSASAYSAFWVGLGGSSDQSSALEQVGTQSDCTSGGQTSYYAWYELVPSAPVKLDLAVSPGDHVTGRVTVSGSTVTVTLSNQTTGASATKTLTADEVDTSSAEWIAEAPSECDQTGNCQPLPLADFSTVDFTSATATAGGHTGSISDSAWSAHAVQLNGTASGFAATPVGYTQSSSTSAEPSTLSSDGSSFSVSTTSSSSSTSSDTGTGASGDGSDGYGGYTGYGGYGGYGGYSGYGGYGGYSGYGGYGGYGDSAGGYFYG